MYKVLLVDDERIILEGISNGIDWAALDTILVDTARNGVEAYEKIVREQPHIVISDIKMPGMDGLALAAKVHQEFPSIRFILLSGFSEFEYARSAMQYGVKHYLLKPCNEHTIMETLEKVIGELKEEEDKEQFVQGIKSRFETAQPYIKEQLLKEFISNKIYTNRDLSYYQRLFNIELSDQQVRLLLFQLEGEFAFEHMYALKNIAEEILVSPLLSTIIGEYVLFIMEEGEAAQLQDQIKLIREKFFQFYGLDTTVAVSEADHIRSARRLYQETLECLNHRFYLGEGSIITKKDITSVSQDSDFSIEFDEQQFCLLIKSGHWEDAREEITSFFTTLINKRLGIHLTKSYVMQLFLVMVQTCDSEHMNVYMEKIPSLMAMNTVQQMKTFFEQTAEEITLTYYNCHKTKHSSIINKVIGIINEHLGNPDLSLKWVANQMLYMNADYLGKLFKQETGERFSNYVMKVRIEKAMEQIKQMDDVKIVTLAEMIGFGDNPQYFSQVFKKHTGCTPSEYRRGL
ncbi:response regulator transcription factor [Ectobacillus funiculus]|uniref:response regulator transcription factor n=1 Tax=Ectobacillus funiculus TaxID=137993 RepID=UPI00397C6DAE